MDATCIADEIFRDKLANLGNEAKSRLIELLAKSLTFSDKKEDDTYLFDEICGAWSNDGMTAEQEIEELRSSRNQDITHNTIDL